MPARPTTRRSLALLLLAVPALAVPAPAAAGSAAQPLRRTGTYNCRTGGGPGVTVGTVRAVLTGSGQVDVTIRLKDGLPDTAYYVDTTQSSPASCRTGSLAERLTTNGQGNGTLRVRVPYDSGATQITAELSDNPGFSSLEYLATPPIPLG